MAEASAPNLGDMADDHEAVRVDLPGQGLDPGQLVVGDDTHNDLCLPAQVAALAVEKGAAPVHLGQNGIPDPVGMVADDFYFRPAGAQQQYSVQSKGNNQDQDDSIEQIFQIVVHHLRQQDAEIKGLIAIAENEAPPPERDIEPLRKMLETDIKEVYNVLDAEDKQRFWRTIIKEIKLVDNKVDSVVFQY